MSNITYTDKVAGASGAVGQWRAADANEVKNAVNSKADSLGAYTTLSGTAWDGTPKKKTLTSNTALTLSTAQRGGKIKIVQDATGGRTLSINGVSIPILTTANSVSLVMYDYDDVASLYDFYVDTSFAGNAGGGDVTAPVRASATIENAAPAKIVITYNETLDSGSVPTTGQFNATVDAIGASISSTAIVGATVEVTLSTPVTAGQVVVIGYSTTGNPIQDAAGNDAAAFSGVSVTNNVGGSTAFIAFTAAGGAGNFVESPTGTWNLQSGAINDRLITTDSLASSANGWVQMKYTAAANEGAVLGLDTASGDVLYSGMDYGVFLSGGNWSRIDGGTITGTGVAAVLNQYIRIARSSGNTLKLETSPDGTTWTTIHTFSATSTAQLYPKGHVTAALGVLSEAKGSNLT